MPLGGFFAAVIVLEFVTFELPQAEITSAIAMTVSKVVTFNSLRDLRPSSPVRANPRNVTVVGNEFGLVSVWSGLSGWSPVLAAVAEVEQ